MKQNVSPGVIIGVIVVVVVIIVFIAFKTFGGNPNESNISPQQVKEMQAAKMHDMTAKRDANGHFIDSPSPGTNTQMLPKTR
jgi:hypothetical protein